MRCSCDPCPLHRLLLLLLLTDYLSISLFDELSVTVRFWRLVRTKLNFVSNIQNLWVRAAFILTLIFIICCNWLPGTLGRLWLLCSNIWSIWIIVNTLLTVCWKCQISRFQPAPKMIATCSCAQTSRLFSHTPAAQHNQPGLVLNFPLGGTDNQKKAPVR